VSRFLRRSKYKTEHGNAVPYRAVSGIVLNYDPPPHKHKQANFTTNIMMTNAKATPIARYTAIAGIACTLFMVLGGCAGQGAGQPPEQLVSQLAAKRWDALVARDFEKAYGFSTPSYRQLNNADFYKKSRQGAPVKWVSAKVLRVECEDKKCAVRIALESKPLVPFPFKDTITSGLDESWVYEDGQWWILETL
jgi:hypothetical protein